MTVNKAEPISLEEEELLWESGALGDTDSMTIIIIYIYHIYIALCLLLLLVILILSVLCKN